MATFAQKSSASSKMQNFKIAVPCNDANERKTTQSKITHYLGEVDSIPQNLGEAKKIVQNASPLFADFVERTKDVFVRIDKEGKNHASLCLDSIHGKIERFEILTYADSFCLSVILSDGENFCRLVTGNIDSPMSISMMTALCNADGKKQEQNVIISPYSIQATKKSEVTKRGIFVQLYNGEKVRGVIVSRAIELRKAGKLEYNFSEVVDECMVKLQRIGYAITQSEGVNYDIPTPDSEYKFDDIDLLNARKAQIMENAKQYNKAASNDAIIEKKAISENAETSGEDLPF
jgi:hypothetical protein